MMKPVVAESHICDQHPRFVTVQVVLLSRSNSFDKIGQIFYFIFEGTVSICIFLLLLGSMCATCVCNITCTACAHMKKECKLGRSCLKFVTQKKKHCFCMFLVLSLHG